MSDRALSNPELPKRAVSWLIWIGITVLGVTLPPIFIQWRLESGRR
jgi:hypothetical protein